MARRVPLQAVRGVPMSVPFYSASFLLFLLPLLALVAVGRKKHARARTHSRAHAKAASRVSFAKGRRKQPGHGPGSYNLWSEEDMEGALTELAEAASTKNPHMEFNLKKTAHKWNIPRKTQERYFHKPGYFDAVKSAAGKGRGILTRDEEEEIVQLALAQHAAGMALNHTQLKWVIMEVVRRVSGKANTATGKAWLNNNKPSYTWYRRFLERHSDRIRSRVVENLDPKWWKVALDDLKSLYDILDNLRKIYPDLPARNVCNLDETNITHERRKSKVLAAKGARRTHTLCNEARFSMTALPVVFADGSEMPPHFIIKGKRRPKWWGSQKYCVDLLGTEFTYATLAVQANGWMDSEIFLAWFTEYFLPFTADRRSEKTPVILVLDNFSRHVHPATLKMARENNVIMVGLPPHSTHITQPLDVTLMKPLKDFWTKMLAVDGLVDPWDVYTEQDVIRLLCEPAPILGRREGHPAEFWSPWAKAFTPDNIRAAFRSTGIWPTNFQAVADQAYVLCSPSESIDSTPVGGNVPLASSTQQEAQPSATTATPLAGRRSASTHESATQPLPTAIMTAFNQQELQLQAEIVEAERKHEALRRKLEQMRRKRGVLEAFSVDLATICHGFVNNDNRPTKRTRRDGRGRTEALVLNTAEQIATAEAKLML
eukprot:jgi/Tetstr1/461980/TSEL_007053.t1